jgi:hypothetical protein
METVNVDTLITNLIEKVKEIKNENKNNIPVIFILVGTFPGISKIHQTPPIIEKYLENPLICPIVILIDPFYKKINENNVLNFLSSSIPEENQWYYPDIIPFLDISYHKRVAYQYYPYIIKKDDIQYLLYNPIIKNNLTLLWCFDGLLTFINYSNEKLSITESNCIVRVEYNINYWQLIAYNIETQEYYFKPQYNTIEDIFYEIDKNKNNNIILNRLQGFAYNLLKNWYDSFKKYRTWEIFIRNTDEKHRCQLTKKSTQYDWIHFQYRTNINFIDNKNGIQSQFIKSEYFTLNQYLNNQILQMGGMLIKIYFLDNKPNSIDLQKYYDDFKTEHELLISRNSSELPGLFQNILQKFQYKYSQ